MSDVQPDEFQRQFAAVPAEMADEDDQPWIEESVSPPPAASTHRSPRRTVDRSSPLPMVETAFLASAASLIWLVNAYFPIGPVLRIFFPVPIALVYLRWGKRAAWMAALVAGLLLTVLMGPVRSIQFVVPFGLMGVLLGGLWRRRASWAMTMLLGTLLGAFGTFFRIGLVSILVGDDLWLYATTQVTELVEWVFLQLGWLIQPSLQVVQLLTIGMILLQNLIYQFVVHVVALLLFDRLGDPISRPPRWVETLLEYEE
jgi:uncharacterized protein YybS (DUF2232 family)